MPDINSKLEIHFLGSGDAFGSGGLDQTCFYIKTSSTHLLLDCGCSALVSLNRAGVSPSLIDLIIVSHFHADHFGGIPFLIRQQHFDKRQKPLTVVGPKGIDKKVLDAGAVLFPSGEMFNPSFPVQFIEYASDERLQIDRTISLMAFPVEHVPETHPHAIRLNIDDWVIAFSGDTRWTNNLIKAAHKADVFICECYTLDNPSRIHMHYQALLENEKMLNAKRIILTHCSDEVLNANNLRFKRADEVGVIELGGS